MALRTPIKPLPRYLIVGTLLPDIIDKPLYYGLSLVTGQHGAELGLISGSRTFGHTLILMCTTFLFSVVKRSPALLALGVGMATHLLLDHAFDLAANPSAWLQESAFGLFWPFMGNRFPIMPYDTGMEHLGSVSKPHIWMGEILGAVLLVTEWIRHRNYLVTKT